MPASIWAIVVAGGDGRRFGGPKQFELVNGRRVLDWAIDTVRKTTDDVVLVLPEEFVAAERSRGVASIVVAGGSTRSASVRAGLVAVPDDVDVIVVHDAARPLATRELFTAVIDAVLDGADAAIPGVAVSDTIKRVENGFAVETLDREELVAVQTPQAFRADVLRLAHKGEQGATDDAALVEAIGHRVAIVDGESTNIKLTEPSDLETLERALCARSDVELTQ